MMIKEGITENGYKIIEFQDLYAKNCSIQESSLATDNAIWIGVNDNRMHLNKEQVIELIPILKKFADTGEL